jgi:GNAT superfamily N-acetyltransferase
VGIETQIQETAGGPENGRLDERRSKQKHSILNEVSMRNGLEHDSFTIEPLTCRTLSSALALVRNHFPRSGQGRERAELFFRASLSAPGRIFLKCLGYPVVRFWVARDIISGKVLGTVGLFTRSDEPEAYWGGWLCVDPEYRGRAIGNELIMKDFREALQQGGRPYGRVLTSTDPQEARAQELYERAGLKVYREVPDRKSGHTLLYRQVSLS